MLQGEGNLSRSKGKTDMRAGLDRSGSGERRAPAVPGKAASGLGSVSKFDSDPLLAGATLTVDGSPRHDVASDAPGLYADLGWVDDYDEAFPCSLEPDDVHENWSTATNYLLPTLLSKVIMKILTHQELGWD